ncbi:MAG: hypothetical protein D6725_12650 [Planctomycetota bacterium]|nr:MAG: hypothetical protein D6725_12650 [Planctomycetota bacterium]
MAHGLPIRPPRQPVHCSASARPHIVTPAAVPAIRPDGLTMTNPHAIPRSAPARAAESLYQRHRRFRSARSRKRIDRVVFAPERIRQAELDRIAQLVGPDATNPDELRPLLEMLVAARFSQKHVRTVGDWITALQIGLALVGVRPGHRVAMSSYTDFSHVVAVWRLGAIPCFVDIDDANLQVDPQALRLRFRTRDGGPIHCLLLHHLGGSPAGVAAAAAIAREHEAAVVEVVWGTMPPRYGNRPAGSVGDVVCINSRPEGSPNRRSIAFVGTDDDRLAERLAEWLADPASDDWPTAARQFGASFDPDTRRPDPLAVTRTVIQLENDDARLPRRQEIAATYNAAFSGFPELGVPREQASDVHTWNLYPLQLNCNRLPVSRKAFRAALEARGVETRTHYLPAHTHPALRIVTGEDDPCPVARRTFAREVSLPIHDQMTDEHAAFVVQAVVDVVCRASLRPETLDVP